MGAWSRRWGGDALALASVVVTGAVVRVARLTTPSVVFDEGHYTSDACCAFGGATVGCLTDAPSNWQHPPIGKLLLGLPMELLGCGTGAARLAALLAGLASIALLYVLTRSLLGSRALAVVAAGLLVVDPLHLVHSRTAMLDVFVVTFVLAAFTCWQFGRVAGRSRRATVVWWTLAGVAGGAATAVKWSGAPALVALAALSLAQWRRSAAHPAGATAPRSRCGPVAVAVCFLLVPALVYVSSYAGQVTGGVLSWPWAEHSWWRQLASRQTAMWSFHARLGDLGGENPFTSPAWSWPLLRRPVVYAFDAVGGQVQVVLAVGNVVAWWSGLAALAWVAVTTLRGRGSWAGTVAVAGVAATWLPWLALDATRDYLFLYYFLPTVPFLYLAVAVCLQRLPRPALPTIASALLVAAAAFAAFMYPVLTARPLAVDRWQQRVLFADCARDGMPPPHPLEPPTPGPPPTGWCWR